MIAPLQQFAKIDPETKRPPLLQFEWGTTFPTFRGVIEQLIRDPNPPKVDVVVAEVLMVALRGVLAT